MDYNLDFDKLCSILDLGELVSVPKELSGGLMNRNFMLETTSGKYAVKALNPAIMKRPTAMQNYINSEKIASIVCNNINAVPAIYFNSTAVQTLEGQHYLIFHWCNGTHLFGDDICIKHCEEMGRVLAQIHMADFSSLDLCSETPSEDVIYDWNHYLHKGIETNATWCDLLQQNLEKLYEYSKCSAKASRVMSADMVISHADLEPKNTLWVDDMPYIIDWEAAGFVSKYNDILETALYWSRDKDGRLVKDKCTAFMKAYKSLNNDLLDSWDYALDMGYSGMLGWLEYSLKRSLWIECSDDTENKMGTQQVFDTIKAINNYASEKDVIRTWLAYLENLASVKIANLY